MQPTNTHYQLRVANKTHIESNQLNSCRVFAIKLVKTPRIKIDRLAHISPQTNLKSHNPRRVFDKIEISYGMVGN